MSSTSMSSTTNRDLKEMIESSSFESMIGAQGTGIIAVIGKTNEIYLAADGRSVSKEGQILFGNELKVIAISHFCVLATAGLNIAYEPVVLEAQRAMSANKHLDYYGIRDVCATFIKQWRRKHKNANFQANITLCGRTPRGLIIEVLGGISNIRVTKPHILVATGSGREVIKQYVYEKLELKPDIDRKGYFKILALGVSIAALKDPYCGGIVSMARISPDGVQLYEGNHCIRYVCVHTRSDDSYWSNILVCFGKGGYSVNFESNLKKTLTRELRQKNVEVRRFHVWGMDKETSVVRIMEFSSGVKRKEALDVLAELQKDLGLKFSTPTTAVMEMLARKFNVRTLQAAKDYL